MVTEARAQVLEEGAIEVALGAEGIEVNLDGAEEVLVGELGDAGGQFLALARGERGAASLDAVDGHEVRLALGQHERLAAAVNPDVVTGEGRGGGEEGDADIGRVGEAQVFRALPSPDDGFGRGTERVARTRDVGGKQRNCNPRY